MSFHPDRYARAKSGLIEQRAGITETAAQRKRETGVWRAGHEYIKAPDGNIYYDLEGIHKWLRWERTEV